MFFNNNNYLSKINVINGNIRKQSTGGFCDINTTSKRLKFIFKRNFFNIIQREKKNENNNLLNKIIKNEQIITLLGSMVYYGINIIGKKRLGTIIINSKRAGILGYVNYITESAKVVKEYIISFNPLIIPEKIIEKMPQVIETPIVNVVEATTATGYSNQTIVLLGLSLTLIATAGIYIGWSYYGWKYWPWPYESTATSKDITGMYESYKSDVAIKVNDPISKMIDMVEKIENHTKIEHKNLLLKLQQIIADVDISKLSQEKIDCVKNLQAKVYDSLLRVDLMENSILSNMGEMIENIEKSLSLKDREILLNMQNNLNKIDIRDLSLLSKENITKLYDKIWTNLEKINSMELKFVNADIEVENKVMEKIINNTKSEELAEVVIPYVKTNTEKTTTELMYETAKMKEALTKLDIKYPAKGINSTQAMEKATDMVAEKSISTSVGKSIKEVVEEGIGDLIDKGINILGKF